MEKYRSLLTTGNLNINNISTQLTFRLHRLRSQISNEHSNIDRFCLTFCSEAPDISGRLKVDDHA